MSLTLILMRHAKSAWDDPELDDFERPLNGRGRQSAEAIGQWLVTQGHLPDTVLVSGARRTVETWERMSGHMPETAAMESSPALYLAGPDIILNVLKSRKSPSIMVICHNPGIAEFAKLVAKASPDDRRYAQYPTAATAVISFEAKQWEDVRWHSGQVIDFIAPRDLLE